MIEQTDHIGVCETSFFYHQQSLRLLKHELFFVSEEDSQDFEEEETQENYPDEGDAADEEDTKKESDSGIMTLNK